MICALAYTCVIAFAASAKPPHIVMMVLDDLGWNDLGYRSKDVKTPAIDRMEAQSVSLLNYYGMSSCAPTRSTLMTGRHVTRTGIYTPFAGNMPEGVPLTETFLPQTLKKLGYATHMVGKWHLGFYKKEYTPTFRGFDTFYGFYGWGENYFSHMSSYPTRGGQTSMGYDFRDEDQPNCSGSCSVVDHTADGHYSTNLFAARAVRIIETHNPEIPLFLYLPWQAVHAPRNVPASYAIPFAGGPRNADFCGMVAAVDEGIENVTEALSRKGMLNESIIIVTADNGGPVDDSTTPGIHEGDAIGASNYPLRGGKHSIFEGGVRLTSFVWASTLKARRHYGLMHTVDWYATLAKLAGASSRELDGLNLDSKDQWSALQGGGSPHDMMFLGCQFSSNPWYPVCALRSGDWKFIVGDPHAPYGWSEQDPMGEATGRELYGYSLQSTAGGGFKPSAMLLYNVSSDLSGDVSERHNLLEQEPSVVSRFLQAFLPWNVSRVPYDFAMDAKAPKGVPIDGVWGPWVQTGTKLLMV